MHAHLRAFLSLTALALVASCDAESGPPHDADLEDGGTLPVPAPVLSSAVPAPPRADRPVDELAVLPSRGGATHEVGAGPASPLTVTDAEPTDADPESGVRSEQPAGFHFAFTHGSTYVVLRARTEPEWGEGPLSLAQREWPTVVLRAARAGVPLEELTGTRMVLRSGGERACVVELGAPQVLRRAHAASAQYAAWEGEDGAPRASDAQVAAEAWELAVESELLVAKATPVTGDCTGAHWAHPEHVAPQLATAAIGQARVLRAFRRLEGYREYQSAWADAREYDDDPGFARWDARPGAHRRIQTFRSRDGRAFALVSALAHDGCGDFTGGLWALFEVTPRGLATIRTEHSFEPPLALVDLDADGSPEVLFRSRLTHVSGDTVDVTTPFFDCPC